MTEAAFETAVIGAGHAACEAALAAARMGCRTAVFAINLDSVAFMPCNPSVGGTSKGHLVREIDALGGEMGRNTDKTMLQTRMLNTSKGPAVYSLRAQADKRAYSAEMKRTLENTDNLRLIQAEITDVRRERDYFRLETDLGEVYRARAVVAAAGTYLNAECLYGLRRVESGPSGFRGSKRLRAALEKLGLEFMRFKTGTPARLDGRTLDYSRMTLQPGDDGGEFFSFENEGRAAPAAGQTPCYLTYTTARTREIILENLRLSPFYAGEARGTGARYCPSIEDKIVRFADKETHQVFIEPEGAGTNEVYVQGVSTALPPGVQTELYRSVAGLERCEITRPAYAIEYDCADARGLTAGLMARGAPGLFLAGQVNGSSGYEEAAAQGIIAGINAANYVLGREPFKLDRSQGYIGVLIDDLVTKGTREPYRMMTSRAEYRLVLRQDNADARLTPAGFALGLVSPERWARFTRKRDIIKEELKRARGLTLRPSPELNGALAEAGTAPITAPARLDALLRRPELNMRRLAPFCGAEGLPGYILDAVNTEIKYEGYIERQNEQISRFKEMEGLALPEGLDYAAMSCLRTEARQKLEAARPANIGQAGRISGVSPADISALMIELKKRR
ncbi:MAG: tRNA uridine-5-carboxymethylaminomethyl(34) synthesis enzyme MnmG [Clostridiales bacterium]|jgi:tRNA uridine 5-carboxymethylaminomethyl modification enzyme|nr:tRNA uridine-5-carboxymethylaminomethyl(34) synthesis enzyme MnmG [Clostridiales bacterium]